MLSGRISDQSVAATLRLPLPVSRRVGVTTAVGGALHRIALSGSFDTMDVSSTRYDPAVRLGVIGSYAVNSRIGLGFGVSADWLLRRQSYESSDTALLEVPSIQVALGVALLARIL